MSADPLNTVADLIAQLRGSDARTGAALEGALWAGELEVWLQARWRPAADAPRLAAEVRALRQRLQRRGALARFALLNLLEPGQPLPLGEGLALQEPGGLEGRLQALPPARRGRLLETLQQQVAEGFFAEWLRAGGFPGAPRLLAVLEDCQARYPHTPLLLAYAVRWWYAPSVGVPFAREEIANPGELAARIAGSDAGRQAGLEALRGGWLRTWLCASGRLQDPATLDRTLDDPRLPEEAKLDILLRLLDPTLPWPQPHCDPPEVDFGWVRPEASAERLLTITAEGNGFLWGEARLEPLVAGLTLTPTEIAGTRSRLRLQLAPRGLPLGSRHSGMVVVRTAAGEVRVPWRFAVGARWVGLRSRLKIGVIVLLLVGCFVFLQRTCSPVPTESPKPPTLPQTQARPSIEKAEAEAKRKAEDEARRKAEAEAKRRVEEERKQAETVRQQQQQRVSPKLISGRYRDNNDGTVTDTQTSLRWKRCSEGQTWTGTTCSGTATEMTWYDAMSNTKKKKWEPVAGYSDWRLPTEEELGELVYCSNGTPAREAWDYSCAGKNHWNGNNYHRPTIDPEAFPYTPADWYWSSPLVANDTYGQIVHFGTGNSYGAINSQHYLIRLVQVEQQPPQSPNQNTPPTHTNRESSAQTSGPGEQDAKEIHKYAAALKNRIESRWMRPPGLGNLRCTLEARLLPGGEVVSGSVRITKSSGSPDFDRSVESAVYKASPLPVPSGRLFESFRTLLLVFGK